VGLEAIIERTLAQVPEIGPAHRVLARIRAAQDDAAGAARHFLAAADKESSAEPLVSCANLWLGEYEKRKESGYAARAAKRANEAIERDPGSDTAWYALGWAQQYLANHEKSVEAFDQVSPSSELYGSALNNAASIYFEQLGNEHASFQRLTRAIQLTPDDLGVLSNYAEVLFSAGRNEQARIAAVRSREHGKARLSENSYVRAAMSFVAFGAELFLANYDGALAELDQIERNVNEAAVQAAREKNPRKWQYEGTRRSLERRLRTTPAKERSAILKVLAYVERNGQTGSLGEMRTRLQSAKTASAPAK
jgi:tetratricopeptide (TPR) repeat protein